MYTFDRDAQFSVMMMSLGVGFVLGLFYDLVRTLRLLFTKSKAAVFVFDLLYFAVFAFCSFLFMLAVNKGEVRLYIILGEFAGAAVYYFSFGAAAVKVTNAAVRIIKTAAEKIFAFFALPFKAIYKVRLYFKHRILGILKKIRKKSQFFLKKHLKKLKMCVYNLFGVLFASKSHTEGNAGIEQSKKNR